MERQRCCWLQRKGMLQCYNSCSITEPTLTTRMRFCVVCDCFNSCLFILWPCVFVVAQDGYTALMKVERNNRAEIVEFLLKAGADIHIKNTVSSCCSFRMFLFKKNISFVYVCLFVYLFEKATHHHQCLSLYPSWCLPYVVSMESLLFCWQYVENNLTWSNCCSTKEPMSKTKTMFVRRSVCS